MNEMVNGEWWQCSGAFNSHNVDRPLTTEKKKIILVFFTYEN